MNHTTRAERERLLTAAREHIRLDDSGEIVGGFTAAWMTFRVQHNISDARARGYVSKAARIMRGEHVAGPGRRATLDSRKPVTVYLNGAQVDRASELGSGNVSEGVRYALDTCLF